MTTAKTSSRAAAPQGSDTSSVVDPELVGSVVLRGVAVAFDTDVGQAFVLDCVRNTEGLVTDRDIKTKYGLSDQDWERLADNKLLLQTVRVGRERRIHNGDAAREAAQQHFARAPAVLGDILTDNLISPRHRIEAARELRQVADNGPDAASGPKEKFVITINLGEDQTLTFEKDVTPREPPPHGDGEM